MKPKHCLCLICVMRVWSSLRCILPHATGPHSQLSEAPWRFCFFLEIPTGSCLTSLCTCVIKLPLNGASCDTDAAFGCSRLVLHSFKQGEHITARARFLCFSSPLQIVCASLSLSNCSVEKITSAAFQGKHFIKILTRHAKKATAGRIIDLQKQLDAWIHKD